MKRTLVALALVLHLLVPAAVWAQEKSKSPLDYSLKQYGLVLGAALLGGIVSWYSKVRAGLLPATSINALVGELCTAAFGGLMCFWICEWAGFPPLLTAPLSGIVGHMGARGVTMLEQLATQKLGGVK